MLQSNESRKLLRVARSAGELLDVVGEGETEDAAMQFPVIAPGLGNLLLNVTEMARQYEFFQIDPDERQILCQLAAKNGAKDWQTYLQGLIYLTAKEAGLPADNLMDVPGWAAPENMAARLSRPTEGRKAKAAIAMSGKP